MDAASDTLPDAPWASPVSQLLLAADGMLLVGMEDGTLQRYDFSRQTWTELQGPGAAIV